MKSHSLCRKIRSTLAAATSSARQRSGRRSIIAWFTVPLTLAAAFAVVLGLVFLNQRKMPERSGNNALLEEVISGHVRSLCRDSWYSVYPRSGCDSFLIAAVVLMLLFRVSRHHWTWRFGYITFLILTLFYWCVKHRIVRSSYPDAGCVVA